MRRWFGPGLAAGVSGLLLVIYLLTCSRTVGLVDSGELSAVAWTLGIAHPTGYPLWTLLAFAWSHLFPMGEPVWRVAVMSGLASALAGGLVFAAARMLGFNAVASVVAGLSFGLTPFVWSTSISAEVYGLGGLLTLLFLVSLLAWEKGRVRPEAVWYAGGLVLANHMSGLSLVLPGLAYMVYRDRKALISGWAMFLSLSIYLFLPIRSAHEPFFDWGDPQTLTNFIWHITGKQYSIWMFSGGLGGFFSSLGKVVSWLWSSWNIAFPAALLGLVLMRSRFRWALVAGVLLSWVYLAGYSIPDIGDYFVPLTVMLSLGLSALLNRFRAFAAVGLALPVFLGFANFKKLNRRGDSFPQEIAQACLVSADSNAVILCNYWDMVSPMLYLQQVKGLRRDVMVVDKELLRRSWYLKHIRLKHPGLYSMLISQPGLDEKQLLEKDPYRASGPFIIPRGKPPALVQPDLQRVYKVFQAFPRNDREKTLMSVFVTNCSRSQSRP